MKAISTVSAEEKKINQTNKQTVHPGAKEPHVEETVQKK